MHPKIDLCLFYDLSSSFCPLMIDQRHIQIRLPNNLETCVPKEKISLKYKYNRLRNWVIFGWLDIFKLPHVSIVVFRCKSFDIVIEACNVLRLKLNSYRANCELFKRLHDPFLFSPAITSNPIEVWIRILAFGVVIFRFWKKVFLVEVTLDEIQP